MWSPMGPHVQWDLPNVVAYGYNGTSLMWSPVGPHFLSWTRQVAVLLSLSCKHEDIGEMYSLTLSE